MLKNFLPALKDALTAGAQAFQKRLKQPGLSAVKGEEWPEVEWDEEPPAPTEEKEPMPPEKTPSETKAAANISDSEKKLAENEESRENKELKTGTGFDLQKLLITLLIILLIIISVSIGLYFGGLFDGANESSQTPQQQLEAMQISYNANNFVKYAAANDVKVVELFLKADMDVNSRRSLDGVTPLMAAAGSDRKNVVQYLLAKGAYINDQDDEGQTALMKAVKFNQLYMVDFLLEQKADHTIADNSGNTVVSMIKERGDSAEFAEIFLRYGIDISSDVPKENAPAEEAQNKTAEANETVAPTPSQPTPQPNNERDDGSVSVFEVLKSMDSGDTNTIP
jgi:hypothetical protein